MSETDNSQSEKFIVLEINLMFNFFRWLGDSEAS